MDRIPFLAWVGIAIIVIFTLVINISLIAMLRAKTRARPSMRPPRAGGFIGAAQNLAKMGPILRDPFAGQRGQLDELSKRIQELNQSTESKSDAANINDAHKTERPSNVED